MRPRMRTVRSRRRDGFTRRGNGNFEAQRSRGMARSRQGKILVEPGTRGSRLRPECEDEFGRVNSKETGFEAYPRQCMN